MKHFVLVLLTLIFGSTLIAQAKSASYDCRSNLAFTDNGELLSDTQSVEINYRLGTIGSTGMVEFIHSPAYGRVLVHLGVQYTEKLDPEGNRVYEFVYAQLDPANPQRIVRASSYRSISSPLPAKFEIDMHDEINQSGERFQSKLSCSLVEK